VPPRGKGGGRSVLGELLRAGVELALGPGSSPLSLSLFLYWESPYRDILDPRIGTLISPTVETS
jgi:hypothetical protein